jgi:hypothetical protein
LCCRSSPSPSLNLRSASSQSAGAAVRTKSQDSERTVSEVAVREAVAPDDHAATESPTLEMMVTVAAGPSEEVARASTPRLWPWSCCLRISQFLLMLPLVLVVSV